MFDDEFDEFDEVDIIPSLTHNAILDMYKGLPVKNMFLQLLDIRSKGTRVRLVLSDSTYYYISFCSKKVATMVSDGVLQRFNVVLVKEYMCNHVRGQTVLILLDLSVVDPGPGTKMGEPVNVEQALKSPSVARGQSPNQQRPPLGQSPNQRRPTPSHTPPRANVAPHHPRSHPSPRNMAGKAFAPRQDLATAQPSPLSTGCISKAFLNKKSLQGSFVQVINIDSGGARVRLLLSDGLHSCPAMLSSSLDHVVKSGKVTRFSVVELRECLANLVGSDRVLIVLGLTVCGPSNAVLGNPSPLATALSSPAWTCDSCTFSNPGHARACGMCQATHTNTPSQAARQPHSATPMQRVQSIVDDEMDFDQLAGQPVGKRPSSVGPRDTSKRRRLPSFVSQSETLPAFQRKLNNNNNHQSGQAGFGTPMSGFTTGSASDDGFGETQLVVTLVMHSADYVAVSSQPYDSRVGTLVKQVEGYKFDSETGKLLVPRAAHDALAVRLRGLAGANVKVKRVSASLLLNLADTAAKGRRSLGKLRKGKKPKPDPYVEGAPKVKIEDMKAIPESLRETLFPFQTKGVEYAVSRNGRALIGDEMGLGKTIQAIAIAAYYKKEWPILVICPSSVRLNWRDEFLRWLPGLVRKHNINVVANGKADVLPLKGALDWLDDDSTPLKTTVVISSYDLIPRLKEQISKVKFQVVICDESHYLKNEKAKRTLAILPLIASAPHALLLTGTPALSRPYELFTQINSLAPGRFGSKTYFGKHFCNAKKGYFGWEAKGAMNLEELHLLLKTHCMIRRKKEEVLTDLKPKTRTAIMLEIKSKRVKKLCETVEDMHKQMLDLMKQPVSEGADAGEDALSALNSQRAALMEAYSETGLAKLKAVTEYIRDLVEGGVKFLVFAHHKEVMDGIEAVLMKTKVGYFRIDGSTAPAKRHAGVKKFQESSSCRVALLSITAGGTGLTLTAASQVVFAELTWTPALLVQAEDRVHRIGQPNAVNIAYLIGTNTLDDKMWPMLCKKLEVVGNALDGEGGNLDFEDVEGEHSGYIKRAVKRPRTKQTADTPSSASLPPDTQSPESPTLSSVAKRKTRDKPGSLHPFFSQRSDSKQASPASSKRAASRASPAGSKQAASSKQTSPSKAAKQANTHSDESTVSDKHSDESKMPKRSSRKRRMKGSALSGTAKLENFRRGAAAIKLSPVSGSEAVVDEDAKLDEDANLDEVMLNMDPLSPASEDPSFADIDKSPSVEASPVAEDKGASKSESGRRRRKLVLDDDSTEEDDKWSVLRTAYASVPQAPIPPTLPHAQRKQRFNLSPHRPMCGRQNTSRRRNSLRPRRAVSLRKSLRQAILDSLPDVDSPGTCTARGQCDNTFSTVRSLDFDLL